MIKPLRKLVLAGLAAGALLGLAGTASAESRNGAPLPSRQMMRHHSMMSRPMMHRHHRYGRHYMAPRHHMRGPRHMMRHHAM